ncbi:MAG: hypothetical protein RMN52_07935 [Anaerolineae bacterium]|nr:hypothetical protein [Candidatus Roseilinea sp.]MDW8449918.1 hypothetical protein [Anaerolineae bacterium]
MDKLNKAAAASLVMFSVVLAAFIGSRVDQVTIALLGGTFIGLLIAIPSALLVMVVVLRRRDDADREHYDRPRYTHMPPSPPQYWVMPTPADAPYDMRMTQPPSATQVRAPAVAPEYVLPATRRRFYLIGESGEMREIEAPFESGGPDNDLLDDSTRF